MVKHTYLAESINISKQVITDSPQALLMQTSTLPYLVPCSRLSLPPTSLQSPSLQFPLGVEMAIGKKKCHTSRHFHEIAYNTKQLRTSRLCCEI